MATNLLARAGVIGRRSVLANEESQRKYQPESRGSYHIISDFHIPKLKKMAVVGVRWCFFFFFLHYSTIKKNSAFKVTGEFASPQLVATGSFRTP